ncbi:DMT family transporter [Priestia koreensis]|uniref:DMT family transporter n=1 Tax=Priestia koreensis TaxID=284581 RepID=UPI001F57D869|nr:SMR family transporter [Priestia koreensis]MCM3002720.1 SMR family transporter [Priestia koreensis]UNL84418.1 multidrug efflux SMR transporter [Priestia koreensis]
MISYFTLALAIVAEVFGSSMLKASNGFSRVLPIVGIAAGYAIAFYSLSIALKGLPLGMVYATWSGVGTILTVLTGILFFQETINQKGALGIFILLVGITLLNFTK